MLGDHQHKRQSLGRSITLLYHIRLYQTRDKPVIVQMSRMVTPALPEEIYVHIFSYIDPADLWLSTRLASKTFNRIIESHLQLSILPFFQISISYNLGGARWYDDTRCFKPFVFLSHDAENLLHT